MMEDERLQARLAPLVRTVETVFPETELVQKLDRDRPLRCCLLCP